MPCSHCPWPPLVAIWGRSFRVLKGHVLQPPNKLEGGREERLLSIIWGGFSASLLSVRRILSQLLKDRLLGFAPNFLFQVVDHYENPRNVGSLDKKAKNVGTGLVGAPACGDVMKLQVSKRPCFSREAQPSRPVPSLSVSFVWTGNWCLLTTLRSRWTKTGKSLTPGLRRLAAGQQSLQVLWRLSG